MKKRIVSLLLAVVTVALVLTGCATKLYDYSSYKEYLKLGKYEGIEIQLSYIENGMAEKYHEAVESADSAAKEDKDKVIKKTEYKSATENKPLIEDLTYTQKDTLNIDFVGKIDGKEFEGGSSKGYSLVIGSGTFITGFEEGLIGYTAGDKVSLNLTFPKNYSNAEYAGKDVVFDVTINSFTRSTYPEFNNDNVKKYVTAYKDSEKAVEDFEKDTRKEVEKNLIWQEFYSDSKMIKVPEKEVRKYYETSISQYKQSVSSLSAMYGYVITLEDYVTSYMGYSTLASFYQALAQQAKSSVKQELLVLTLLEEKPDLRLSDEAFEAKVKELYDEYVADGSYTKSLKKFKKDFGAKGLEISIYNEVVMDYLYDKHVLNDDVTKNGFVTDRNGTRYYENNEMKKGWLSLDPDGDGTFAKYYFNEETGYAPKVCALMKPEGEETAKYLSFGANGLYNGLFSGVHNDGTGTLHIVEGVATTGLKEDFSPTGKDEDKGTYYYDPTTGYMATGITKVGDFYYDFGTDGKRVGLANGLIKDNTGTRLFVEGALQVGYKDIDHDNNSETENITVYFDPNNNGYMVVSDAIDVDGDGAYEKFDKDGKALGKVTGFFENLDGLRYFDSDGKLVTGFHTEAEGDNAGTYYFDPDRKGYAYKSKWYEVVEGEGEGAHSEKKYYFKSDCKRAESETLTIDNVEYIFGEDGIHTVDTSNDEE